METLQRVKRTSSSLRRMAIAAAILVVSVAVFASSPSYLSSAVGAGRGKLFKVTEYNYIHYTIHQHIQHMHTQGYSKNIHMHSQELRFHAVPASSAKSHHPGQSKMPHRCHDIKAS